MRRGQATTEYFVLVSVFIIACLATAYALVPEFQQGIRGLSGDTQTLFSAGTQDGSNGRR